MPFSFLISYRSKIMPSDLSNNRLTELLRRLGWIGRFGRDRKDSFVNFNEEKQNNTIRIGCFGDSFTEVK